MAGQDDGLFQGFLTVLDELAPFKAMIESELLWSLPYLASTKVLTAAVRAGVGREQAHEIIAEHARLAAAERRERGAWGSSDELLDRWAKDERLRLSRADIDRAIGDPILLTGAAAQQVAAFVRRTERLAEQYPRASAYRPEPIL